MTRKQGTDFGVNRITTAMAVAVAVVVAVVVAVEVAVAVAIADLVTETITSEAVLQKVKREQRDQVASNSITAFVRLVPAPICSLASAPRFGLQDFSGILKCVFCLHTPGCADKKKNFQLRFRLLVYNQGELQCCVWHIIMLWLHAP